MKQFITYAQNNEDVILNAFFKDVEHGTYVDIGANHPVKDSVTKHFYNKGWRGINVEPIKKLYDLLQEDRPEDINVQMGIAGKSGTLKLREYGNDGLSTFSDSIKQEYVKTEDDKTATYTDVSVPVITLAELFAQHPLKHIHFMKVDVEGYEHEVLKGNDWKKFRPEIICIETNHQASDNWANLLEEQAYSKVWNDGLNDYYLAKESKKRQNYFSYPEVMLLSGQIIPYHVVDYISDLIYKKEAVEQRLRDEEVTLQVQLLRRKQLEHENHELTKKITEQQRFSRALVLLLKAMDRIALTQIERLHTAKATSVAKPHARTKDRIYDTSLREALLTDIRESDLQAYFSSSKRRSTQKFYLYHTVRGTYMLPRRIAKRLLRGALKLTKRRQHVTEV